VFKPIFEPIILRFEADEESRRLAMTGNDNFLAFRFAKIARQIILDFRKRNLALIALTVDMVLDLARRGANLWG
jgi:hypothetical protein